MENLQLSGTVLGTGDAARWGKKIPALKEVAPITQ